MFSRDECLTILGLAPEADSYEIENRYTMLVKRYRSQNDPESIRILEEISLAYNILTGRHVEQKAEDPRLETVILGKTRRQWRNIWHYGRVPLLLSMFGVAILGYFIFTIFTNSPPDFQIGFVGAFGRSGNVEKNVETYILDMFEDFESVEVLILPMDLSSVDGPAATGTDDVTVPGDSNLYNYMMKMLTLIVGDSYEVFVCDQMVFDRYAREGAFADLTELYAQWETELPDQVKPLRRRILENDEEGLTAVDPSENDDLSLPVFGLDVTGLNLAPGFGIYGDTQILTIGIRASAQDEAEQFLKAWILDYEEMNRRQAEHEATMATSDS